MIPRPPTRRPSGLTLVVALAAALRVVAAARAPIIEHDGAMYASLAAALLRGDAALGTSTLWPPGFPALIAAAALAGRWLGLAADPAGLEAAARAVAVVAGTLLLVPLWALASRLLDRRAATWVTLLAATHPRLVQYSGAALTEMPFACCAVAGWAALAAASDERRRAAQVLASGLGAGVAWGLAYLVRPEGLPLALVSWCGAAVAAPAVRRGRAAAAFGAGLVLTIAPYLLFLHAGLGAWSLGEKGPYNFWRAYRSDYAAIYPEPEGLAERAFESPELAAAIAPRPVEVAGFVARRPALVLGRSLANLAKLVASSLPLAASPVLVLAALVGLWRLPWRRWALVWAPLVAMPLLFAPFTVDRRFLIPAIPPLLLLAGRALARLDVRRPLAARGVRRGDVAVALLAAAGLAYAALAGTSVDDAPEHRAAGAWLRSAWPRLAAESGEGHARPIVMSRKPWVAWYSGGLIAELPDADVDGVLERVRRKHADVLVIDRRWVGATRPRLLALLDSKALPPGVRVLERWEAPQPIVLLDVRPIR